MTQSKLCPKCGTVIGTITQSCNGCFTPHDMPISDMNDICIYCRDTRYVQKQRATPEWSCANCGNQFTDKEYREYRNEWYRKAEERAAAIKARELAEQSQKPPLLVRISVNIVIAVAKLIFYLLRHMAINAFALLLFYFAVVILGVPVQLIGLALLCVGIVGFGFWIRWVRDARRLGHLWSFGSCYFLGLYFLIFLGYAASGAYLVLLN